MNVCMSVFSYFCYFMICTMIIWSLSSSSSLKNYFIFKQWPTWRWLDFVTTFQNNLAVTKQQIVKKHFHQSWNINCPILFNTISFYTEMISISLSMLWRRFKTITQLLTNKLSKKYFTNHEILTVPSFSTQFHSIHKWYQYLCLGFSHFELNILGTRDISCVLHEIQIWNTKKQTK